MQLKEKLKELSVQAAQMSLLYVEDEALIRDNTKVLLESIFGNVETAVNGEDGLQKAVAHQYDLILTDILMPQMNGVEMIRAILFVNPSQVVIVNSACDEGGYLKELHNLGVAYFLLKPTQTEQMVDVLYEVVNERCAALRRTRSL